jgi:hypothetical protein
VNRTGHIEPAEPSAAALLASPAQAKARLLGWAEEHDARPGRCGAGTLALRGALAVVGGVVLGRMLTRRTPTAVPVVRVRTANPRWLTWALAARLGQWLLPHAISAVQSYANTRRDRDHAGPPAHRATALSPSPARSRT